MQIWRYKLTELLQIRNATTVGRQSNALLMCSCGSPSREVCRATFNSSVVLDFGLDLFTLTA